ncbi:hypothetical protein GCK72_021801 [Caenorhabditis remanei]|uniref:F-box domain-containing protein n=1 Tax=Caenorhabditis remanei TaxID=31234 RepID=A0A6A5GL37_CAERE|nr:hypothetical protein GCK72_021801 [Caenorhabditis remanei]KAF1755232.1 hypothetical protein GCK72_021801 [Caenorhabditis remanei]
MNLLDLPDDNLLEIAGKLDLRGISILRKVNQRLRNVLDLRPPTNNFTKISVEGITYYPRTQVIYESATGTETIMYDDKDQVGRDFELNIRYQKRVVDEFSINFQDAEDPVAKKIHETLKSRNKMLQVKKIFLRGNFQRGLSEILQFLDPTSLKTIATFMSEGDEIQQFDDNCVQLEQWRSAEEFTSNIMIESSACFSKLLNFREVNIWANEICLEDVLLLRKKMNLLGLPDDNLLEIAGKLDLRGISILRKVNQRLRNLLDLRPPTNNFTKISIGGRIYHPRTQVIYESATGSETILYDDRDQAGRDFEVNIRYQKGVVDEFSINFEHAEDPVAKKILKTLKSRNKMLQVKKIFLRGNFQRGLFKILQFLDPTSLKTIATFMSEGDEIQQFDDNCLQLEQWRSAEEFTSNIMIESSACFRKLLHFREVNIWANEIRLEDVLLLRKPSLL